MLANVTLPGACPQHVMTIRALINIKKMAGSYVQERLAGSPIDRLEGSSPTSSLNPSVPRASALSNKLTSVLSASYADLEIRDALETLDERGIENTPETRRRLRLDVQKEVIQCNGEIISEFGQIAEVCWPSFLI